MIPTVVDRSRRGLTLVEMLCVLAILATLAGILILRSDRILNGGDGRQGALATATEASLATIANAITGSPDSPGFRQDLGEIPTRIADLLRVPEVLLSGTPVAHTPLAQYSPSQRRGWSGPYMLRPTGSYRIDELKGFVALYGDDDDPSLSDGWGNPIVLQVPPPQAPDEPLAVRQERSRLVSAGPDGWIDTSPFAPLPNANDPAEVGDDLVLYLYPGSQE